MGNFSASLAGLLLLTNQDTIIVTTGHDVRPKYHQTDYETACGTNVFQVRYRSGPAEPGLVDYLMIDDRPVRDAAATLELRAARRAIDRIEITNCGQDFRHPVFRGVMKLNEADSQVARMRDTLFFRVSREGREDWRLIVD